MVTELFCALDDFFLRFGRSLSSRILADDLLLRGSSSGIHLSEVATILALYPLSHSSCFKHFYLEQVQVKMRAEFPCQVSYSRFVELIPVVTPFLFAFLLERGASHRSGISVVDATKLEVCRPLRAGRHKVFADAAAWGKTGQGFFFGFKLHLVVNHQGEIVSFALTPGNVDDRNRRVLARLLGGLRGYLLGDKGYLDRKLSEELSQQGLRLLTPLRQNMKPDGRSEEDVALLKKRGVVESVLNVLKSVLRIAHTRHRSPSNFASHLLAGLVAYEFYPNKPKIPLADASATGAKILPMAA